MLVYGKYECFVMQMLYVCILCAYSGSSQCCMLHDLQFVNAKGDHVEEAYFDNLITDNFDSCITATLTLFLSSTTSSSVSLFPIPLELSCRTLNVLSSLICLVGGAGDLVGGGDC